MGKSIKMHKASCLPCEIRTELVSRNEEVIGENGSCSQPWQVPGKRYVVQWLRSFGGSMCPTSDSLSEF